MTASQQFKKAATKHNWPIQYQYEALEEFLDVNKLNELVPEWPDAPVRIITCDPPPPTTVWVKEVVNGRIVEVAQDAPTPVIIPGITPDEKIAKMVDHILAALDQRPEIQYAMTAFLRDEGSGKFA